MIEIKQATKNEISIIEEIMVDVEAFLDSINQPLWERKNVTWHGLSKLFKIEDFYIAYLDHTPVGCMALVDYDPFMWPDIKQGESLFIHKLAVKRSGAKKGVSKALLDFAKDKAVRFGIGEVRLDTDQLRPKVRNVYEKQGFVCVEEKCLFEKYFTAFYLWKQEDK